MTYAIIYRDPVAKLRTQFETDDIQEATVFLHHVVTVESVELVDFSPELDGALDFVLDAFDAFRIQAAM